MLPALGFYIQILSEPPLSHLLIILGFFFGTWYPALKGKFVSDDLEGVAKFSDHFVQYKNPDGTITKEEVVDSYDAEKGTEKIRIKNRAYNPYVGFPGSFIRWARLNVGAKFKQIGTNSKNHPVYGYVQDPFKHHIISFAVQSLNLVFAYFFLDRIIGSTLAFYSILLFSIHPLCNQTVAWISGIGYLISFLGAVLSFNLVFHVQNLYVSLPIVALLTFISVSGLMAGGVNWFILLFFGRIPEAIVALIATVPYALKQGRDTIGLRINEFKKQKMGASTRVHWRKLIVMMKTFYYYIRLIVFPKRLGLFHVWGYHYDETIEKIDGLFWKGFLCFGGLAALFFFSPFAVKLGILWLIAYQVLFMNLITAQQFVVDRYAFIPTFGYCLILAFILQSQPIFLTFILGLYVMRSRLHIKTFEDEESFYVSNVWNFPNSEVALGNLGVTLINRQREAGALDAWTRATQVNPLYDVPWYNLYSFMKVRGALDQAKEHLQRCLNAKGVHFPEAWEKEMKEIEDLVVKYKSWDSQILNIEKRVSEANHGCR